LKPKISPTCFVESKSDSLVNGFYIMLKFIT